MYYTAGDDPANCPRQGLLLDDAKPASEMNAKQDKLDAFSVPYAAAIAGPIGDRCALASARRRARSHGVRQRAAALTAGHIDGLS